MASFSELTCIYLALILHDNKVTITEDKINALIKATGVNVEPFWPDLLAKALVKGITRSLFCNVGAGGPASAGGPAPPPLLPQLRRRKLKQRKKKLFEESDDDMGFGLFY